MHNPLVGRVTSHYDLARKHPVFGTVQPHRGIDLGAPIGIKPYDYIGAPVKAAYAGVVEAVCTSWANGWGAIWGRSGCGVFIRNPDGEGQYYGHLSDVYVKRGQRVTEGQILGGMGVSGNVTGPHLHFEMHQRGSGGKVNPNYTLTRDPMTDFRAAGITPGTDPIIIQHASATTATTQTTTGALTVAQYEELKAGQVELGRKLDKLQASVGGANISIKASNGKTYKTNINGALKVIETLVRDNNTDIDAILERVGEETPEAETVEVA